MNKFLALVFALFMIPGLSSCAALASALPIIDSALTDTQLVLKGIETTFDAYQATHPVTPEVRAEYDKLLASAYQDLTLGERAVADGKAVNQGDYDQAMKDFGVAFKALTGYLKTQGITPIGSGLVGAGTQGGDDFPTPRVIGLKVSSSS